uniref:Uncharacterized protein n=1 Tax=Rhizophora mucronata TaxID=61149 RepID=A0A2P2PPC4_RHIMU
MGKNFAASEESKLAGSENCKSTKGVSNLSVEVKPLCKSEDIETEGMKSPMPVEEQSEDAFASKESQGACDLCAPDSVDFMQASGNPCFLGMKLF